MTRIWGRQSEFQACPILTLASTILSTGSCVLDLVELGGVEVWGRGMRDYTPCALWWVLGGGSRHVGLHLMYSVLVKVELLKQLG